MKQPIVALAALTGLALSACALNLGGPRDIALPAAVVRADAPAATAAAALTGVRAAIIASDQGETWFRQVAGGAGLELSGPADLDGLRMAFMVDREALGDTTLDLRYDGGTLRVHDALYDMRDERFLDLLAFRIDDRASASAALQAFLEYVATDVSNRAAVLIAAAVPTAAVGDSVARLLGPGFYDVARCEGAAAGLPSSGIRMFYGPEARMYCEGVAAGGLTDGTLIRAQLVMGRR